MVVLRPFLGVIEGPRPDLHWAREAVTRQQVSLQRQRVIAERAWCMRNAQTATELALWQAIRRRQLDVSFKRQFPIGNRIADFAAPSVKLAIEVDGGYHATRAAADARKDRHLRRAGYRVLRIPAELVMRDIGAAVALVRAALASPQLP